MEVTRHFTATTFVVNNNHTLLHLHKSLGIWLPPGGHIDRDELPHEAAIREVKEETGLTVELYGSTTSLVSDSVIKLPMPQHLLLENINPYHQHIDFIYFGWVNSSKLNPQINEAQDFQWLSSDGLRQHENLPADVLALGLEVLEILGPQRYNTNPA